MHTEPELIALLSSSRAQVLCYYITLPSGKMEYEETSQFFHCSPGRWTAQPIRVSLLCLLNPNSDDCTLLETSAHWSTSCETSSPRAEMHLPSVSQSCRILTPDIHQTLNAAGLSWDLGAWECQRCISGRLVCLELSCYSDRNFQLFQLLRGVSIWQGNMPAPQYWRRQGHSPGQSWFHEADVFSV